VVNMNISFVTAGPRQSILVQTMSWVQLKISSA